jgi:glycosyltransferase involved in cell wall biosynthesis
MTPAIRVLHVGKYYPPAPGGMERVVQLLCESERGLEGIDSRVLVANTAASTRHDTVGGVPVTRLRALGAIGSVGVCPGFPWALWRATRDVTVIHEPNPVALVADFLARQKGPLVVWFHSEVLRPQWKYQLLYRPFLKRVLARASRIVVSSPPLAEHAAELQPFRDKCVVVPFGIDRRPLEATPDIAARVEALKAETPGPRLLFIGRLVPYKGVDVLLRAMADVDATAWIVGSGPLRDQLEADAARLGVASRVQFLGGLPDAEVVARLHACDVFVLPSVTHAETFGMVQLEAMACGVPVVSTSVRSGVPWVNQQGQTGLVVEPGNADELARALRMLIADPGLRRRLGEAGRARVASDFTLEAMASQTAALYRDVTQGPTQAAVARLTAAIRGERAPWPVAGSLDLQEEVIRSAVEHGVESLVASASRRLETWPSAVRERLAARATSACAIEALRERELRHVLSVLAGDGAKPLVAKGAALAYSIYQEPHLRARVDTDLIVSHDEMPQVVAALERIGYARAAQNVGELVSHQVGLGRTDAHGVWHALDVHWKVANPQVFADLLPVTELRDEAVPLPALGPEALMPSPVHALLLAIVHLAAHHARQPRLIWLYDLHLLASRLTAPEFERVVQLARSRGVAALTARALRQARAAFDTRVEEAVLAGLDAVDPRDEAPARFVDGEPGKLGTLVSDLRRLPSWQARGQLLREHVFPPADYMLRAYHTTHRTWLPALYVHRAITGGWRWLRQA